MHCPACKTTILAMTERQGVEIDYCPQCRGVWLDRGELDRLLVRAEADASPPVHAGSRSAPPSPPPRHAYRDHPAQGHGHDNRKRKPRSLLGELVDF